MHAVPYERILLAFSGGPDSAGLASALRGAGIDIVLAYADHRLRGPRASRHERATVRRAAEGLHLPLVRTRLSLPAASEGAARRARYRALHALARRHACAAILTAHTADDRAETLLVNLLRGTGLRGLASLRRATVIDGLPRLRPALDERREMLRRHGAHLPSVADRSNRNAAYLRARIRHEVLPALSRRLSRDAVPVLCALADAAEAVRGALETRARTLPAERSVLLEEPEAVLAYAVEELRRRAGASSPPLGRRTYASLRQFLRAGRRGREFRTPGGDTWALGADGSITIRP